MSSSTSVGRIARIAAVAGAVLVVGYLLFGGGSAYQVKANFVNASQIVKGNQVEVAGRPAGMVEKIEINDDGEAVLTLTVDERYAPLRRGSVATVRSTSQSGVANRYVQIDLPTEDRAGEPIPDGGELTQTETVSEVDLDELFNTLDDETVGNLKKTLRGLAASYAGVEKQGNEGLKYFNPFLFTSRRVFTELNRDERALEQLIVQASRVTTALESRHDDVSALIGNVNNMMGALARRQTDLADAVGQLPPFMRKFNSTAVNLRATLDDVDPLVAASKPVAKKLQPFVANLRGFARDARPTISDLNDIVRRRGMANDLVELTRLQTPLTELAVGPLQRYGREVEGAFPASARSLEEGLPQLSFFRPYTPELVGWFDDFSHGGMYDANGGIARQAAIFNAFTISGITGLPDIPGGLINFPQRGSSFKQLAHTGNTRKCPGANERDRGDGSTPFTDGGTLDCDPTQIPTGP